MMYPKAPGRLKKVAMFLASGDPDMYDGAKFSYDGDFLGYLGLEDMGIFTNHDKGVMEKISEMVQRMRWDEKSISGFIAFCHVFHHPTKVHWRE